MDIVRGTTAAGYEAVRAAFEQTFAEELNVGASFAVWRDGAPLVDLQGGWTDAAKTSPWTDRSLACVWSVTKAMTAFVIARLVDRGALDFETPIAEIWPAFAAGGKERATIGHVLAHQAGVPGTVKPMTDADLLDHSPFARSLAAEPALWPPGMDAAYHPMSGGHILNEVARRVAGRTIGAIFRDEIAAPHALDAFIGVPEDRDADAVETIGAPGLVEERAERARRYPAARDSILNPPLLPTQPNTRAWRAGEVPAGNAMATAASLARLFDAALRGEVLGAETFGRAIAERVGHRDRLVETPIRLSYGFMLNDQDQVFGPREEAFGHTGWGGAFAFADIETRFCVAFAPNLMLPEGADLSRRRRRLLDALFGAV